MEGILEGAIVVCADTWEAEELGAERAQAGKGRARVAPPSHTSLFYGNGQWQWQCVGQNLYDNLDTLRSRGG